MSLVVADAGYGKSTLLADFSRRFDGACLWYTLEPDDLDWLTLVPHLVAAGREVLPTFGALTTSLLRAEPGMPPPKSAVISGLLSELETLHDGRVVVIFDDAHAIEESADANELLERLLRQAPSRFSFIFAGRRRPALPLARWAAQGELVELTTDDLRFTREDTARLFTDSYGQPLESDVLDELELRTQGWAACLQLFSTLINGMSPLAIRMAAKSLSGSSGAVFDYLAQEVVAKLSPALRSFLARASLLQTAMPGYLHALFPDDAPETVRAWVDEADTLGLLSRSSQSSAGRHFHPLLREHLFAELERLHSQPEIAELHAAIARAAESEPLVACHHYIQAGMAEDAMRCLSGSTLQTLGSGLSGSASRLAERLEERPLNGAVGVLKARRLVEEGDTAAASAVLASVSVDREAAPVRAAIRQTKLNIAWRTGDSQGMIKIVSEILADDQTPELLREIARVFRDGHSASERPVPFPILLQRLRAMATRQDAAGYGYYAAISTHNAAVMALHAGRLAEAFELGSQALARHAELSVRPPEYFSTLTVMAHAALELGRQSDADNCAEEALASDQIEADVPATFAYLKAVTGEIALAERYLRSAEAIVATGRSDVSALLNTAHARSLLSLPDQPLHALARLAEAPTGFPLDVELDQVHVVRALAQLLAGNRADARGEALGRLPVARARGNRLAEVRLELIAALSDERRTDIGNAIDEAYSVSHLSLPEVADAIARSLGVLGPAPDSLRASIVEWPQRWLPALRRAVDLGDDPRALAAAKLLDEVGDAQDVGRLRAFEKMYRKRFHIAGLGRELTKRASPKLEVHDLGQVSLSVGDRVVKVDGIRRRSGAVLMYLVTRPNQTATRDQVIEEIWPDGDFSSGSNSLNQSLYFLRREIDPWYEDGVSTEYVTLAAELVSLDPDLVVVDSVEFLRRSRDLQSAPLGAEAVHALMDTYRGQFAPEFEYDEWALSWRTRVHGTYLDFAQAAVRQLARARDLAAARDICLRVLAVDPDASDFERRLIWIYWRSGAESAAQTQYSHLAAKERRDGMTAPTFADIVGARGSGWDTTPT